jgi:hypothetical protein
MTNKTDTTGIMIAVGPDDTIVDFAHNIASQMFEEFRKDITELDVASEAFIKARFGEDDASFLLLLLGHLAASMTEYAVYMAAGIYMCAGSKDAEGNLELARGAAKALLKDQKRAAQMGLLAAELRSEEIVGQLDTGKDMLDELLKKHKGAAH